MDSLDETTAPTDFNEDEDDSQLLETFSAGFSAPAENDDPFKLLPSLPSTTASSAINKNDKKPTNPSKKEHGKSKSTENANVEPPVSTASKKLKGGGKSGILKGKSFRVLKAPHMHSFDSAEIFDPEEEKLKMLPDCCEFTVRKNDGYEADESRKDMTSAWFTRIKLNPVQQKQLCFSESLLMVEENGTVVGKMYCSVTLSKWCDKPCFCVHAGSSGKFTSGLESGTSITSFVNFSLKPLQEFVHEWASLGKESIERKILIMNEGELMPVKIIFIKNGNTVDTKSFSLGYGEMETLVTEATNVLLQRLLINDRRTNGSMNLQCLSYAGKVVKAKYSELGSGWENVRGKQMKTWGIRRTVFIKEKEERVWDSLYNKYSRLILRCQPDSPQALIPLWFESIIDFDKHGHFTGIYSPYAWACDMELYAKYSIKKEEITHEHRRYIMDHPEVKAMLSDYLQAVLFRKPQNIVEFTKQYFESFASFRGRSTRSTLRLDSSSASSSSYYGSYMSMSGEMGEGEWYGEGEDGDAASFYPVNPTVNYEGLEKVDDVVANTSDEPGATENETEDDLVVNEQGDYVHN